MVNFFQINNETINEKPCPNIEVKMNQFDFFDTNFLKINFNFSTNLFS